MRAFGLVMTTVVVMSGLAAPASAQIRLPRQLVPIAAPARPVRPPVRRAEQPDGEWYNLYRLSAGTTIEISLRSGAEKGDFVSVTTDTLTVDDHGRTVVMAREDIRLVEQRTSEAKSKALGMALKGAAAGFMLSALADESSHRVTVWRLKLIGGGAVLGAAVGAVGGSVETSRRVLYHAN